MVKTRLNIAFSVVIVLSLAVFQLRSQTIEKPAQALTLDQCLSTAIQQNPLILSSLKQYQASLARVRQAKAFSQPSLNIDSDVQPGIFKFKDSAESYFGLSQTFQFPGKRQLKGKIVTRESDELMADIDLLKLDIVFRVKEAFYGLLLAQQKLLYIKQDLDLAQDFLKKTQLKFDTGDVAKVEILRAKVEAAKTANEVRKAENDVRLAKATLNFLLARKKYAPLEIQGKLEKPSLELNLEELKKRAISFRPEIRKIGITLHKESLKKKQAYMSYLPDFDIGVSRHKLLGEATSWDVTLSFPIPLFFWQPKRGEIAESEANMESIKKQAEHLENAVSLDVEQAYTNAQTADNQIKLFKTDILAQAEEAYNLFLFSYQEGEIGGIELIEARRSLIEARKSYADALFNYDTALAALEKSIGQRLDGEK